MGRALFDILNAPAESAADAIFAETFAYQPMRVPPNGEAVVDNGRDAIAVLTAIWLDDPARLDLTDGGAKFASDSPKIFVLAAAFAAPPRKGDYFTRAVDGLTYRAEAVRPDGVARLTIDVVEAGE